uniref:Uncharacterized protein n=1 Tax=Lepeophtheirus salmonis TaxID=72036 RepID=A0A0K2TKZ2_LEPSM
MATNFIKRGMNSTISRIYKLFKENEIRI